MVSQPALRLQLCQLSLSWFAELDNASSSSATNSARLILAGFWGGANSGLYGCRLHGKMRSSHAVDWILYLQAGAGAVATGDLFQAACDPKPSLE